MHRLQPPPVSGQIFRQVQRLMTEDAAASGRRVVCGLSYMQRVRFGGQFTLWQPPTARDRAPTGRVDWVSAQQVEFLQENSVILESMEIMEGLRSIREHAMSRAGGLRVTIITAGVSDRPASVNDQQDFTRLLQDKLRHMDQMRWLDEFGQAASAMLTLSGLSLPERVPQLYTTLGAAQIYRRSTATHQAVQGFLNQVTAVTPANSSQHDVMIGIKEPRCAANNQRPFNRLTERLYLGFFGALSATYAHFGLMPTALHMRSYGDHVKGRVQRHAPAEFHQSAPTIT